MFLAITNHFCYNSETPTLKKLFSRVFQRNVNTYRVTVFSLWQMVSKSQLTIVLLICAVILLLTQPVVSQKDALRWGKRDSGLPDKFASENFRNWRMQRYNKKREYLGNLFLFFSFIQNFWILMVVSLHFHYHPLIDGLSYFIKHEYFGPTCSNRRTVWNLSTIISDVKNVIVFEENFKLATDMTEIIYLRAQFVHFSIYLFINSFM